MALFNVVIVELNGSVPAGEQKKVGKPQENTFKNPIYLCESSNMEWTHDSTFQVLPHALVSLFQFQIVALCFHII